MKDSPGSASTTDAEVRKFTITLCKEHLDEVAFLYAQVRRLLSAATGPWTDAQRFEQRLDAHFNALIMEGEHSLDICQKLCADSKDPGDLYAVTRIFCRCNRPDLASCILKNLNQHDEAQLAAVCNALFEEARFDPRRILDVLSAHPAQDRVMVKVATDARLNDARLAINTSLDQPARTLALVLRLCGRIHTPEASLLLGQTLDHDDQDVRWQAALAHMRLGNAHDVIHGVRAHKPPMLALGLAGGKPEVDYLISLVKTGPATRDMLISLGLLGEMSAIPILIENLDLQELAESAALALELITGAGIKEEIFIPDPIDPKELFKDELEKYERGQSPYPPGKAPGVAVARFAQNRDRWQKWIDENHQRFTAGTHYRNGRPYCPECLIAILESQNTPKWLRQLAYEELVIRYQKDIPLEANWPTFFKKQAIETYRKWAKTVNIQPGRLYLAGRPIR
jgi:uncharacterized protein (TIGR02270 family)